VLDKIDTDVENFVTVSPHLI